MVAEQFPDAGFLPPHGGGGEMSAYTIANNLAQKGVNLTVITNTSLTGKVFSEIGCLKVIRVPLLSQRFNGKYPFSDELRFNMQHFDSSRVLEIIKKLKPDVLHIEHKAAGFVRLRKIAKIPVVLFVRDYWPLCISGEFFNGKRPCFNCTTVNALKCTVGNGTYFVDVRRTHEIMYNLLLSPQRLFLSKKVLQRKQNLFQECDKIVANSEYVKRMLATFLNIPENKLGVIYPPLPSFPYVKRLFQENDKRIFAYIGWLTHGKGVINLLKAFHKALKTNPNISLKIFGRGNLESYIKRYIILNGLTGRISFEGFLEQSKFCKTLESVDVVIVPSLWPEPFGRITSEAMLCGRPVIINPVGGLTEQVKDGLTGFYANAYDINMFAEKILDVSVVSRSELLVMGNRARDFVLTKFNNDLQVRALMKIYEEIRN